MEINKFEMFGRGINSVGFNSVFVCNSNAEDQKTVEFPSTFNFDSNLGFKVVFINGYSSTSSIDSMTINNKPVKVVQNGSLVNLPVHELTESNVTVYRSLQENITLDLYYDSSKDAFIIIGNPLVISNSDNVIYADGTILWSHVENKLNNYYGLTADYYTGTAKNSDAVKTTASAANSNFKIPFLNKTGTASGTECFDLLQDTESSINYNPYLNRLNVGSVYSNLYGVSTTSIGMVPVTVDTVASGSAKEVTLAGFTLNKNAKLLLKFTNNNTSLSKLTLNVNGTGAKDIYLDGVITSASNYKIVNTYTYLAEYNGTAWFLDSTYTTYYARNANDSTCFGGKTYANAKTDILSGNAATATNATCFGGKTYANAKTDILSGNAATATNSTCFGGKTYAEAKTDFRSGLGNVSMADKAASNAGTAVALVTGTTSVGKSTGKSLTFNTCTGELVADKFTGALTNKNISISGSTLVINWQ